MQFVKTVPAFLMLALLTACAHPIVISPDMAKLERDPTSQPIKKNVGYYIAESARTEEITTAGAAVTK